MIIDLNIDLDEIQEILDKLISDKTLFVGINNMFYNRLIIDYN